MKKDKSKVPFFESLIKSQLSSLIATAADYTVFIICSELFNIYYVVASGIGSFVGAWVSFTLGRNWAFRKKDGKLSHQAVRYFLTSGTSLILNTVGIYLLTEMSGLDPKLSKVLISILVGIFFNFFMYRYFVYK